MNIIYLLFTQKKKKAVQHVVLKFEVKSTFLFFFYTAHFILNKRKENDLPFFFYR